MLDGDASNPTWRRFQAPQNPGRGFEKFVAAVQRAQTSGVDVRWNDRIGRRQFDVTLRKTVGSETELTVIELATTRKADWSS